jgi:hypothetical protein
MSSNSSGFGEWESRFVRYYPEKGSSVYEEHTCVLVTHKELDSALLKDFQFEDEVLER